MFEVFHEVINNVRATIEREAKVLSKPVIGVMPAYFPMELVEAANGYPVQLWGNNLQIEKADTYLQSFCCSVARSMLELEMRGYADMVQGYAFTSLCDTLINLREIYRSLFDKPTVELSIPITQTDTARKTYLGSVVNSVTSGLEKMTGSSITSQSLAKASDLYNQTRALQRELYAFRRAHPGSIQSTDFYAVLKAGFFLSREHYNRLLEELLKALKQDPPSSSNGVKLVLSGMVFDPMSIHQILDDLGFAVVDDDFANGWRAVSKTKLETASLVEGVFQYLFYPAPCCCLYNPANDRHDYMVEKVNTAEADAVLFWYINFCEPDAFDRPQLEEHLKSKDITISTIDLDTTLTNTDAVKTRLSAFHEMLEA